MVCPLVFVLCAAPPEIVLDRDGAVIETSVRVKPGTYRIDDANEDGIVHVRGDGITIDCTGVTIAGADDATPADRYRGRGLVAEGCRDLTVKGLAVRGVKVGMLFRGCDRLALAGCDVSRNWRQHLKSTPRGEDGADWLYGHENDKDEWLRYGAGIYVQGSKGVAISGCRARNGQNGICLSRVDDSAVFDNDMSFLSGWGLAMWRSSRNDVSNNKFDWCIRGFSYRVYHRGQDSTGILVYEQCSDNVFAYNSATHGGDGFFLYAGNETLQRTGAGGCNRNLLYRNDFSHAAANGIEATFSDSNLFIENRLDECDHGVWGGFSYHTVISGNSMRDCTNGVSIEHGHASRIEGNAFERCGIGVHLWGGENAEFKKTPYGRKQDSESHGWTIVRNSFAATKVAIALEDTRDVTIAGNSIDAGIALRSNPRCAEVRADAIAGKVTGPPPLALAAGARIEPFRASIPRTRGTRDAFLPGGAARGWRTIFVDDWGPYDFSTTRLFPAEMTAWGAAEFHLLGPERDFSVSGVTGGVTISPMAGRIPATIRATASGGAVHEFSFGVTAGAEALRASGILLSADWDVKFYGWESRGPGKPPEDWDAVVRSEPLDSMRLDRIDFVWGGGQPSGKVPNNFFATVATADMDLPAGRYEVRTVSDDGVRVWIDGKKVLENWKWHGPTEDKAEVTVEGGKRAIRIEHFEIDGWAQLQFFIRPLR